MLSIDREFLFLGYNNTVEQMGLMNKKCIAISHCSFYPCRLLSKKYLETVLQGQTLIPKLDWLSMQLSHCCILLKSIRWCLDQSLQEGAAKDKKAKANSTALKFVGGIWAADVVLCAGITILSGFAALVAGLSAIAASNETDKGKAALKIAEADARAAQEEGAMATRAERVIEVSLQGSVNHFLAALEQV